MRVDAKFCASSSRGLGSFIATLVCWQIDFLYNQFSNLFCAKSANLKHFERACCHHKPRQVKINTNQLCGQFIGLN